VRQPTGQDAATIHRFAGNLVTDLLWESHQMRVTSPVPELSEILERRKSPTFTTRKAPIALVAYKQHGNRDKTNWASLQGGFSTHLS
jgi:hypothetical protein